MSERSALRRETDRFLLSLQFFTRVPIPARVPYSEEELNRAVVYFPLIGTLIGTACALVYQGAALLWPEPVAILLSMVFGLLLTGCFHEDGLADCMDGMGARRWFPTEAASGGHKQRCPPYSCTDRM